MLITRLYLSVSIFLIFSPPAVTGYFTNDNGSEEIYVHTDRDIYMAGEEMFFRLYPIPGKGYNNSRSKIAHIVLRNADNTNIVSFAAEMDDNGTWGHIYLPDTLSTGFYHLTSFTNWMRNFGEENFSNKQILIVNRFDKELELPPFQDKAENSRNSPTKPEQFTNGYIMVSTCSEEYGIRQPAKIEIDPKNIDSLIYMSVSIVPESSIIFPFGDQTASAPEGKTASDNYRHLKEKNGYIISGMVTDNQTKDGVEGVRVLLTTPDNQLSLMYAETESDGTFHMQLSRFYDGRDLYLSLDKNALQGPLNIIIDDKTKLSAISVNPFEPDSLTRDYILSSQDIVRVRKVYNIILTDQETVPDQGSEHPPLVYSNPLYTIFPDHFEPLNDFQEISRELLRVLRIRKQTDQFQARMLDERSEYSFFNEEPAIFLDGLIVNDINSIMELTSDDIKRIEILNYQWVYGNMQFPGILAIFTENEFYREINLPEPSVILQNKGFLSRSGFPEINHTEKPGLFSKEPDFRQLLFWEPDIVLKRGQKYKAHFHTSDLTGKYIIVVKGITADGKRQTGITRIRVNKIN